MANIVLAHGILGFSGIGIANFEFIHYFNGVKKALKDKGHKVIAPQVSPVASIEARSAELCKKIINEFGALEENPRLIILAHSMGGLDARHALFNGPVLARMTDALVTIGTPHKGSPIADIIAEKWLPSNVVYKALIKLLGDSVKGLANLTQDFCEKFDAETLDVNGIRYFSVAGKISQNSSVFFRSLGAAISGVDDGVVPYTSAKKSNNGWTVLDDWPVDHAGQIGWFDPLVPRAVYKDQLARYVELVDKVLSERE
ncbi:MAG TPA: hypothetical protein VIZ65_10695 [Cellvibrionaceae bacterium]